MERSELTLQGRNLLRTFGKGKNEITAVNDVSLELYRGKVSMLMGPSGSGKSTLLAILSGLLPPNKGDVIALGRNLWELSETERRRFRQQQYGFIFQGFNLLPALNARQQLEIVLRWGDGASAKEARQRSEEMLNLLGLEQKHHLLPEELSGGEKQRVAIGRALIKKPSYCFADEAAHRQSATVLIVAHDPRIVPFMDRVWNLRDGCLTDANGDIHV
jgi:putative ABC transport system ATP-binding protein